MRTFEGEETVSGDHFTSSTVANQPESRMSRFQIHTLDTAPEESRPSLEALRSAFGFLPNIAGAMATSPVLIASLVSVFGQVHNGSFTEQQIQILLLTNAVTNKSEWAVAFHSALALRQGITAADVGAIRAGRVPEEPKLAALSTLAKRLIETRGKPDAAAIDALLDAGFEPKHVLEVIAVSAASTMTNYTASVTKPPLEDAFAPHAWHAA
jgi:alkylhydroperoxidase family enzyme